MPRYDRYQRLSREISNSIVRGEVTPQWAEDGQSFTYAWGGKNFRFDLATGSSAEIERLPERASPPRRSRTNPERGRQFSVVFSEDGKLKAEARDRNVTLSDAAGKKAWAVTTDGSAEKRTKYGTASWVYGEELGVREAMWFSPDGRYLAYYFFDESPVKDYYLTLDETQFQNKLDVEAYPKAGADNPKVALYVCDVQQRKSIRVDTAFAGGDPDIGHYIYSVRWSPDGKELLFHRTNRKQNVMEFCAADPKTGKGRVVLRESQPQSWTDNTPEIRFLADKRRFLLISDRDGFRNLYLYDLDGKLLAKLTRHKFDVDRILAVVEETGQVFYQARSGDNPYLAQAHAVGLDGKGERRLTDPQLSHTVTVSPTGSALVDVAQSNAVPPSTRVLDANGKILATIAESDLTKFDSLRLRKVERIEFLAADGKTKLWGDLHFPSDFDPAKKYPLVVSVYAGPESGGAPERFRTPDPATELGFLIASFDGRGTDGRGKAFKDAVYGKLGVVEIDDQAAGVRALAQRPYVDGKRVGIHGSSYGGYASAMALLRHPEVFAAACASSSVTDWRHYDTIYTERYMGLPWENENLKGYEEGSAIAYAKNLKGRLMLFWGTADNNVHPANTMMLAQALNRAGKSYRMMAGPDQGHVGLGFARTWEFFIENLVLGAKPDVLARTWNARVSRARKGKAAAR